MGQVKKVSPFSVSFASWEVPRIKQHQPHVSLLTVEIPCLVGGERGWVQQVLVVGVGD